MFPNIPGSEYTRITQPSECVWMSMDNSLICLIMSEYGRIMNTNLTLLRLVSLRSQFAIFENSLKKNLRYFRKKLCLRCLAGLWICYRSWIYQGSEYARVLIRKMLNNISDCVKKTFLFFTASLILTWISIRIIYFVAINTSQSDLNESLKRI